MYVRGGVVFDTQIWFNDLQMTCFAAQRHVYVCVPNSVNLLINPIMAKLCHVHLLLNFVLMVLVFLYGGRGY